MDLVGIDPAQHWGVMAGLARRADAVPQWESIWVYDHFHTVPVPSDEATHEAWTLMAAFAGVTGRVRLGQMCTCMSYRNPAYLAKVAATVDIVSEGRLEMGIGAGWYEHEWLAYGYGFPSAGERLARLREGVDIAGVERFCNGLQRFLLAVSWGGYESLQFPTAAVIGPGMPQGELPWDLVRIYVGLEDPEALIADLEQALALV